jgi:hypothetical protein
MYVRTCVLPTVLTASTPKQRWLPTPELAPGFHSFILATQKGANPVTRKQKGISSAQQGGKENWPSGAVDWLEPDATVRNLCTSVGEWHGLAHAEVAIDVVLQTHPGIEIAKLQIRGEGFIRLYQNF